MGHIAASFDELSDLLAPLRAAGQRIVSTNGCFDLLHVGHLRYLQAARALGDCLVVALNSDASVKQFKSDLRPILPQAERAELLAALNCVDFVLVFDAPSPIDTLLALKADVHAKGADYNDATLPEAPALAAAGIQRAYLPLVEGRSTSSIIAKILAISAQISVTP